MAEDLSGIPEIVAREAELVERFVRLLEREKTLLAEGRADLLAPAVEEKEALAAKLNELTRQRGRALAGQGFSPDRAGMASWSARHPEQKEAIAAWNDTLSSAAQAKELNRQNGQLIQLHMQFTGQALEILQRREERLDLYGPDGRSSAPGNPRIDDTV
ncbi:MAG: flagellar protein FlgN [Candidatus Accumulibacter sp.]|jgi:flagella synthesis protein FlgN|nr:flagellar protein FlgN [Accumulibacter sp.]